jgi:aspartate/methionine/tyrosine aminotransferase
LLKLREDLAQTVTQQAKASPAFVAPKPITTKDALTYRLTPTRKLFATLGSKEGFANMAQAITAPGDVILVPNPSYPIHAFGFLMAGGVIRSVPSNPTPSYFSAMERAMMHSIPKPIAVVVCASLKPTAEVASLDFYKDLVAFAKTLKFLFFQISLMPKSSLTTRLLLQCCKCLGP